jgi:predicted acyltransferase
MRIASIDVLRALTMLLMIWVNDFWTLTEIPKWLQHAGASEDYMGFSDVIFPLFLFIVGLSIPFAIQNRLDKNESRGVIAKHILIRSFSLLLIGVYMVNLETAHGESMPGGKNIWGLLMALAVTLIWMNWNRSPVPKKWHLPLQGAGFAVFIYLAWIYKGGSEGEQWMTTQWWGILGLIGWAYILNALLYLYAKGNMLIMLISWLLLNFLAVLNFTDYAIQTDGFLNIFSTLYTGTIPAFTAAGIVATLIFRKLSQNKIGQAYLIVLLLGIVNIAYGLASRPIWGISKIQATPSWLAICTGIGFLLFLMFYYIADIKKKVKWFRIIAAAGTATLTCYMMPYFIYPIRDITGIRIPEVFKVSFLGLVISFGFALLVVIFTGALEKKGYSLKL